jgi:hypothetical protein
MNNSDTRKWKPVLARLFSSLLLLVSIQSFAGETLYKELEVSDGDTLAYAVHLPDGFDNTREYPVLIGPSINSSHELSDSPRVNCW